MKIKSTSIFTILCSVFLILTSCSKTSGETGADRIEGTYTGYMQVTNFGTSIPSYPDSYVVKIEARSGGKVRVSCVSEPAVFEAFTTSIIYANGTTMVEGQTFRIFYQNISRQLALTVAGPYGNTSFSAFKP